jgi:eukaryotic-like serine/threonine-protein kinase
VIYSQWDAITGYDLWILPLFGNRKPISFLQTEFHEGCGTFSPDVKWIAYASDESGRSEIYVQAFSNEGAGSPVGNGNGRSPTGVETWPKWRRDGKELLYLAADRRIVAVDVKTRQSFEHGDPQPLFASGIRTPDARFDVTSDGRRFLVPSAVTEANSMPATVIINWTKGIKP